MTMRLDTEASPVEYLPDGLSESHFPLPVFRTLEATLFAQNNTRRLPFVGRNC